MNYICEQCGAVVEGKAAPCGAEVCPDCCKACYDMEGWCEDIDHAK